MKSDRTIVTQENFIPFSLSKAMQLLICSVLFLTSVVFGQPEIEVSSGKLKGRILKSRNGRDYYAFTGIPYAEPPLGALRFMPPLPGGNWTGVLDATKESPLCFQWQFRTSRVIGQEDCLYLNVYTPKISNATLPVMVYIHGGGFFIGQPGPAESAKYFMDEDVVLVMPNYRLGRLGFLSFEDENIPGNMGLKDQALAVEWAANEIDAFGGDPNLITVFGNSAGGVSAHYLCSSPRLSGLIKGCISQSGVGGTSVWTQSKPGKARTAALALAEALGCNGDKIISCLQSKPVEDVMDLAVVPWNKDVRPTPLLEPPSEHAVITSWPPEKQNFSFIAGVTADEGMFFTGHFEFIQPKYTYEKYIAHFKKNIVENLGLEKKLKVAQRVLERFLTKGTHHIIAGRKFGTEAFFLYPTLRALNQHSGPKYFYVFNYTGGPSYFEVLMNKDYNVTGVCHNDDFPYFFHMPYKFIPDGWPSPKDVQVSQTLIKIWVTFAKEQSPDNALPQWKQFKDKNYFSIENDGLKVKNSDYFNEVVNFWKVII